MGPPPVREREVDANRSVVAHRRVASAVSRDEGGVVASSSRRRRVVVASIERTVSRVRRPSFAFVRSFVRVRVRSFVRSTTVAGTAGEGAND